MTLHSIHCRDPLRPETGTTLTLRGQKKLPDSRFVVEARLDCTVFGRKVAGMYLFLPIIPIQNQRFRAYLISDAPEAVVHKRQRVLAILRLFR